MNKIFRPFLIKLLSIICVLYIVFSLPQIEAQGIPSTGAMPQLPPELMMSEQELKEMMDFLSTLDEKELQELEQIGRQVLTDMGINPDTLEPVSPEPAKPPVAQPQTPEKAPTTPVAEIKITPEMIQEIAKTLKKNRDILLAIQQHSHYSNVALPPAVQQAIDDLVYYLKALDNPKLIERLGSKPHSAIITMLQSLHANIESITLPPLTTQQRDDSDNPYEVLGLSSSATQAEIETAYNSRMEQLSSSHVTQTLTELNTSDKDIARAIKEAQRTASLVKDAYELLKDELSKERFDRERTTRTTVQGEVAEKIVHTYRDISRIIDAQVVQKRLVDSIEKFFREYEPEQLKLKKVYDDAELARRKEQEALARTRPSKSPGDFREQPRRPTDGRPVQPGYIPFDGGRRPSRPDTTKPKVPDQPKDEAGKKPQDGGRPIKRDGDKKDEKKDKESAAKKDEKKGKKPEKKDEKKKKSPKELIKNASSQANILVTNLHRQEQLLNDLALYTHGQVTRTIQDDTVVETVQNFEQQSSLKELRASLKDLNKIISEKKLSLMTQQDIEDWKRFNSTFTADIMKAKTLIARSLEQSEEHPLHPQRTLLLMGSDEPAGPLKAIKQHVDKIAKYISSIDKVVSAKKEEKKSGN